MRTLDVWWTQSSTHGGSLPDQSRHQDPASPCASTEKDNELSALLRGRVLRVRSAHERLQAHVRVRPRVKT